MAQHSVLASTNFLVPNATFIVELILFVIILGIVARFLMPPLRRTLDERQKLITKQLEDSEAARLRLAEAQQAFQDSLHEARTEAAKIREDARAEAQRTVDELRTSAQQESARIVARGEEQLQAQRAAIVRDLRAEVGTLAVELSEKIVEQPLANDPEVTATVDAFLAGLAADDHARSGAES